MVGERLRSAESAFGVGRRSLYEEVDFVGEEERLAREECCE